MFSPFLAPLMVLFIELALENHNHSHVFFYIHIVRNQMVITFYNSRIYFGVILFCTLSGWNVLIKMFVSEYTSIHNLYLNCTVNLYKIHQCDLYYFMSDDSSWDLTGANQWFIPFNLISNLFDISEPLIRIV